ncbi:splicing factor 3B subunit 1 [Dorcoceras hygrometricum]|uniref:Splicing factor 3B subunit 1 n=1 Tax=Dorcoceras hygrometricum TaxID=472368 RepID=A0A2Z7ARN7_9LAMI|nr:splicing factor 3B subunit 1 [Dorcoceras hygrometricum]
MSSALINNIVQVYFASVLAALVEFLHNASGRDVIVVSTVQGKPVAISEELFASTFELPMEDLTDLHEVSQDLILEARRAFSYSGKLISTSCKKREMVSEFRLLNDILAKSVTVKAGSFDAVTHERFLMMTAIYGGVPVNWGRLLFKIFMDMVTPEKRQARGYAVQICVLLKNAPGLELCESKAFPPLKILTAKTVGMYLAKNKKINVDKDESVVEKPEGKKKAVSKRRPAPADETPVIKRKRTSGKDTSADKKLALVTVSARSCTYPNGSDDEIVEQEPDVVDVVEHQREQTTADDVDKIFDTVITETAQMEKDMEEPSLTRSDDIAFGDTERSSAVNDEDDNLDGTETEIARKMTSFTAPKQLLQEPLRSGEDDDMSGFKQPSKIIESAETEERDIEPVDTEELSLDKDVATMTESEDSGSVSKALELTVSTTYDEESMSLEDILKQIPADVMLPSVSAAEITRVKFARSIEIPEVHEYDCLSKLADLELVKDIIVKGKQFLAWAETDSLKTAVRRREFTIANYREMLLRKFLESHRQHFQAGGNDKKGEGGSSSRGTQPPPDDRGGRPGSGSGDSRSGSSGRRFYRSGGYHRGLGRAGYWLGEK